MSDDDNAVTNGTGRRNWDESFAALVAYKKVYGNVLVPSSYDVDTALGHWVRKQRRNEACNKLSDVKRDRLESIGFHWKLRGEQATASEKPVKPPKKRNWTESYKALVKFKKKQGHCNVPRRCPGDYALGQWCSKQRLNQDSMSRKCHDKLKQLGFDFEGKRDKNERAYDLNLQRLAAYKEENGHVVVPYHYDADPGLGPWVSEQRRAVLEGKLSEERIEKLEALGFIVNANENGNHRNGNGSGSDDDQDGTNKPGLSPRENNGSLVAKWNTNYKSLQRFQETHGNCNVSRNDDRSLSYWVVRQRQLNFQQKLKPDRKKLLDALNFSWYNDNQGFPEHYFEEMMGRLISYQEEHESVGSVDVPTDYERGGLGEWVKTLRQKARAGNMQANQADRLLRIGFSWLEDQESWMKKLQDVSCEVVRRLRQQDTTDQRLKLELELELELRLTPVVKNWLKVQLMLLDFDMLPPKRQSRMECLGLHWNGESLSWSKDRVGEILMVGDEWLVDEIASGLDLKDAALAWVPKGGGSSKCIPREERSVPQVRKNDDNTNGSNSGRDASSPSNSIVEDSHGEEGTSTLIGTKRALAIAEAVDVEAGEAPATKKPKMEETVAAAASTTVAVGSN